MRVAVKVLQRFEGATDDRGTRVRLFEPSDDDTPVILSERIARRHAAAGFVEVLDLPLDEDGTILTEGTPGETYEVETGEDGLPAPGATDEQVKGWLEGATGKALVAWLSKRNVKVARGQRVPEIRQAALEQHEREVASFTTGQEPSTAEAQGSGLTIGDDLAMTLETPGSADA